MAYVIKFYNSQGTQDNIPLEVPAITGTLAVTEGSSDSCSISGFILQSLRPSSDISKGSWTQSSGTTLYETIDELSANDTDYISASTTTTCEIKLGSSGNPANRDNHTLKYRILAGSGLLTVTLKSGSTVIKTWSHTLTSSAQDIVNILSNAEASNIADYSDLRITFSLG